MAAAMTCWGCVRRSSDHEQVLTKALKHIPYLVFRLRPDLALCRVITFRLMILPLALHVELWFQMPHVGTSIPSRHMQLHSAIFSIISIIHLSN
ncbi:hypothetical protein WJ39_17850 [Burkholderia diffusa]|nr:hypothetical protein WJ39_17850 [Burkholderia diffusa]